MERMRHHVFLFYDSVVYSTYTPQIGWVEPYKL
jgi:hypothetical protein